MEVSKVEAKRVSIRAQHRKEELESIFANKRKLMLGRDQLPQFQQTENFMHYYSLLENGKTSLQNLSYMANFLCKDTPFEHFDESGLPPPSEAIQTYSLNLVGLVLSSARQHRSDHKGDVDHRVACITLVSNLLADSAVNNEELCGEICQFLRDVYYSLEAWGFDRQTSEIGWLIGNLIGKKFGVGSDPANSTYVLQWIEELLGVPDVDMLSNIYRNLTKFIVFLRERHVLCPAELPQSFKSNIINIIIQTVQKNLSADLAPRLLIRVVDFLSAFVYVLLGHCPKAIAQVATCKVLGLLGLMSLQCVESALRFLGKAVNGVLKDMAPYQRRILESMQSIRIYVSENYAPKLVQLLTVRQAKVKREILKFIHALFEAPSQHTIYLIATFTGAGLEEVLNHLAKYDEQELKHDCLRLAVLANRLSEGRYWAEFLERAANCEQRLHSMSFKNHNENPL